jgi:hypothetical protein
MMDSIFDNLRAQYDRVGDLTWLENDFLDKWQLSSKALFDYKFLKNENLYPKHLEVYALLSGIEFSKKMQEVVLQLQEDLDSILDSTVRYWVKPQNLGVEYCVFKWPEDNIDEELLSSAFALLNEIEFKPFNFYIGGVQINRDGCVVLKGYDENNSVFNVRNQIRSNLKNLPTKQSSWAHVPIGRILENVGHTKFQKLKNFIKLKKNVLIHTEKITELKLVHETQWYMEKHKILKIIK